MDAEHHLAQVNIGRLIAPTDSPLVQEFMEALEPVNAIADVADGFVWRLQTDEGDATAIRAFDDDTILVNMSTWESIAALRAYVYSSPHKSYLARRREWFAPFEDVMIALWWVPAGHAPSVDEAKERLEHLAAHGPTPHAFTFRQVFDA